MTVTPMRDDWGERRLAEREERRRRTGWTMLGWVIAAPLLLAFAEAAQRGFTPATGQRPLWIALGSAAALVAIMAYALWRTWRDDDEVEWRRSVNSLAAMGVATLLLNPAADIVEGQWHTGDLRHTIWLIAAATGIATYAWQRWRA